MIFLGNKNKKLVFLKMFIKLVYFFTLAIGRLIFSPNLTFQLMINRLFIVNTVSWSLFFAFITQDRKANRMFRLFVHYYFYIYLVFAFCWECGHSCDKPHQLETGVSFILRQFMNRFLKSDDPNHCLSPLICTLKWKPSFSLSKFEFPGQQRNGDCGLWLLRLSNRSSLDPFVSLCFSKTSIQILIWLYLCYGLSMMIDEVDLIALGLGF